MLYFCFTPVPLLLYLSLYQFFTPSLTPSSIFLSDLVNTRREAEMNLEEIVGSVSLKAQNILEALAFKDEIEILNIYGNWPLQSGA